MNGETLTSDWKSLYKIGGAAALMAGVLFRRNIAAEIGLFNSQTSPVTASDWFALLQSNRLLGLAYLNIFDVVNYALVGLMFLGLFVALREVNNSYIVIATALGFSGIVVYFSTNKAFSMLALSEQYKTAANDLQRSILLPAGEALLAINGFSSPGAYPGSGSFLSLLLLATAGMIISVIMLRSKVFNRFTAYVGILASAFDLAYCIAFVFVPTVDGKLLAVLFLPAAGLFLMIWHILVGWKLFQLGRSKNKAISK